MTVREIQSDFFKILKFLKNIRTNQGKILPTKLIIELKYEDIENLSFQPHFRNISKVEIIITNFYEENISINTNVNWNDDYIKQISIKVKVHLTDGRNKFFVFRLDSHPLNHKSSYPHPRWHIQINDRNLDELDKSQYGNVIFINTPRFFFVPIDIITTLDFLLHNFNPQQRENLRKNNQQYRRILEKYQKYFWKPFFEEIYNYFNGNDQSIAEKLLPSLV